MSNEFDTPQSRIEALLQNILGADNELLPPMSNIEKILLNMLGYEGVDIDPIQSRNEALLLQILEQGTGGITPTGTKQITQNGTHDVTEYASAEVNVPNPSTGTLEIDENGTYDVTEKASVEVDVPTGIIPTGTKQISQNGNYDVTDFETAAVNVPQPSGSVSITENGTHDVTQYAIAEVNVSGGGGGGNEEAIIMRTLSGTYSNSNITKVGSRAFAGCTALTDISFPNVTDVGGNAFDSAGVTQLTDAQLPSLALLDSYGFAYMTALQTVNLTSAFAYKDYIFRGCSNVTDIRMPNAYNYNDIAQGRLVYGCPKLAIFDAGKITKMGNDALSGTTLLRTLILRADSVCTISGWAQGHMGGIYSNPTASKIYVPQALISAYQTATNWSAAYAAGVTFEKIEGSIYEL